MKVLPIINSIKKTSNKDINLYYESFRDMFYGLCDLLENKKGDDMKK